MQLNFVPSLKVKTQTLFSQLWLAVSSPDVVFVVDVVVVELVVVEVVVVVPNCVSLKFFQHPSVGGVESQKLAICA